MNQDSNSKFLSKLKAARAPLSSSFKAELKQRFISESEVPRPSLLFTIKNMKRLSFISLSVLILIATVFSVLPSSGLSAQEILVKASEVYTPSSGIYYEKRTVESPAKGGPTVYEYWYDDKGNYLHAWYNQLTGELINAYMYKLEEDGEATFYSHSPMEENSEVVVTVENNMFSGASTYDEDEFVCYVSTRTEEEYKATVIRLNTSEPESIDSSEMGATFSTETDKSPEILRVLNEITSSETSPENISAIINALKNSSNLDYEEVEENGQKYYVFQEVQTIDKDLEESEPVEIRAIKFYIDASTYELRKKEVYYNGEKASQVTYERNHYDDSEAKTIFDATKYNLSGSKVIAVVPYVRLPETGCYNDLYEKLSPEETKELLGQIQGIPEDLVKNLLQ